MFTSHNNEEPLLKAASVGSSTILIFSVFLIISTLLIFSLFARSEFEKRIIPQLSDNAGSVGRSIGALIEKICNYGIPLDSIKGAEEFFQSYLDRHSEFDYISLYNSTDSLVQHSKSKQFDQSRYKFEEKKSDKYYSTSLIKSLNKKIGFIKIGIAPKFIEERLNSITYDVLTVMAITLLITFEMVLFLIAVSVTAPIKSIQKVLKNVIEDDFRKTLRINSKDEIGIFAKSINQIIYKINSSYSNIRKKVQKLSDNPDNKKLTKRFSDIENHHKLTEPSYIQGYFKTLLLYFRPTLFLVVFAESLSISFFPVYVKSLYKPILGMSQELVTGLPISLFMLFWAFSIPIGGVWSDRSGRKKPMIFGALLSAIGFGFTAFAYNIITLLIFRAITALGYGMVYISAQGFIADNTTVKNRTAGMSSFVACFFSGALSGAAIGGILVDRIGYSHTFIIASLIAFISTFFAFKYLNSEQGITTPKVNKFKMSNFKYLLSNKRFFTILVLSSIPAKICLTGYMYYIAPLFLNSLGISNSSIGRFMISYGLSMVVLAPWSGRMADKTGYRHIYVLLGGLLGGLALIIPFLLPNTIGVLLSILGLGIAHATGLSSQLAIVLGLFPSKDESIGSGSIIAIYRLIERIGNISGPIIAGVLLSLFSFEKASAFIGSFVIMGSLLFVFLFILYDKIEKK